MPTNSRSKRYEDTPYATTATMVDPASGHRLLLIIRKRSGIGPRWLTLHAAIYFPHSAFEACSARDLFQTCLQLLRDLADPI